MKSPLNQLNQPTVTKNRVSQSLLHWKISQPQLWPIYGLVIPIEIAIYDHV